MRSALHHELGATRGLVVGYTWWGIGATEMAFASGLSGTPTDSLRVWNLTHPIDRRLLRSPAASAVVAFRTWRGTRGSYAWCLVVAPHRIPPAALRRLRRASGRMVAVLGDRPIGPRAVHPDAWANFDRIFVADSGWLVDLPTTAPPVSVSEWGSTIADPALLEAEPYRPETLAFVGAPYKDRVSAANELATRFDVVCQGPNWPDGRYARRAAQGRIDTLRTLRRGREMVVNVQHQQFTAGLNPQFYDYAAAGIPQVVVYPREPQRVVLRLDTTSYSAELSDFQVSDPRLWTANNHITQVVRERYLFHHSLTRMLNE